MKTSIALLALITASFQGFAQNDTTSTGKEEKKTTLSLGVNSKEGGYARVETADDSTKTKKEPIVIETKRRKITILSEPKSWDSVQDSVDARRAEMRKERRQLFTYWSGL